MRRSRVLIVDDDDTLVLGLLRELYQDNDHYDVLAARHGAVAQQIMRENDVDVIVTALSLPRMSGFDLLGWAATESPQTCAIITTAYCTDVERRRAFELGCLHIVGKPFDSGSLRELIAALLEARDGGLAGSLKTLAPADVIQMLCLGQKTAALRIINGGLSGVVYIDSGQLVHAQAADKIGEGALFQLLRLAQGTFATLPLPEEAPQTLSGGWQQLLIGGLRLQDEDRAAETGRFPGGTKRVEEGQGNGSSGDSATGTPERNSRREVASLIDQGFDAMRRGDLERARNRWKEAQALDPENRTLESNLKRLGQMDRG